MTDEEIFELAYKCYNEDAGREYPDNEFRAALMADLRPFLVLFARKLLNENLADDMGINPDR